MSNEEEKMVSIEHHDFVRTFPNGTEYRLSVYASGLFCKIAGQWMLDEEPTIFVRPRSVHLDNDEMKIIVDALYNKVLLS